MVSAVRVNGIAMVRKKKNGNDGIRVVGEAAARMHALKAKTYRFPIRFSHFLLAGLRKNKIIMKE